MDEWMDGWMDGCMYVCMHVCMYACMQVCMYAGIFYAGLRVCMYCMYACMHVCLDGSMFACMHECMYACMHVCMYARMHVCPLDVIPTDMSSTSIIYSAFTCRYLFSCTGVLGQLCLSRRVSSTAAVDRRLLHAACLKIASRCVTPCLFDSTPQK